MEVSRLKRKMEKYEVEGNCNGMISVCKELADLYFRQENYNEALHEYQNLLELSKEHGNKIDIARAHRMVGEVLCASEDFSGALSYQLIHLSLSREESDLVEEQRALATIGRTYFLWSEVTSHERKEANLSEAKNYYLKSLALCDRLTADIGSKQVLEMRARLFLNMGLVYDSQGKFDSSVENLKKAVQICRSEDLWEDLYRGYCSLATVNQRHGNIQDAISHCDQAILVAKRLPDKVSYLSDLLPMKAEILLELPDFRGARQALLKAYKLRNPDTKVSKQIERKLRTVAAICETEEKLLSLSTDGELPTRKKLYESIADMAASIDAFQLALTYYLLMLECIEKSGNNPQELIECYVSLSQTYLDTGNALMALEYFKKELALEEGNPTEACKTCLNIADALEKLEDFDEMIKYYRKAISLADQCGNAKLKKLSRKSMSLSAFQCKKEDLPELSNPVLSDSSEDSDDSGDEGGKKVATPEYGENIMLESLTDEDGSDSETSDRPRATRSRPRHTNILKRNEKGETPLHVAAINGNIILVEKLLQQGHAVDVKDYSGWTPLHEACNHGHTLIVETLLAAGASINDRGGPLCDGVTPLLDAASNGNLPVMDLLLDRGASPVVRTNKGESVVDCMQSWRKRYIKDVGHDLDSARLAHYEMLFSKMKLALERAGQKVEEVRAPSPPLNIIPQKSRRSSDLGSLRKGLEDKRVAECKLTEATSEYETTIKALRHRYRSHEVSNLTKNQQNDGLVNPDDCIMLNDDWLEDDLRPQKKRRVNHPSLSTSQKCPLSPIGSPVSSSTQIVNDFSEVSNDSEKESFTSRLKQNNSARRTQLSLTASGVTREKVPKTREGDDVSSGTVAKSDDIQPAQHVPSQSSTVTSVKVKIEDRTFLIAVPNNSDTLMVSWLAEKAASRYLSVEGMEPEIRLATDDGALLDNNDPICVVFGCKEVVAIVQSWKVESLEKRYHSAAQASKTKVKKYLLKLLEQSQASGELCLEEMYLPPQNIEALLRTVMHHSMLRVLNLSGNSISEHTSKVLGECLAKLPQLESLNLSSTNLSPLLLNNIYHFLEKGPVLQRLQHLSLAYNPLGDAWESLYKFFLTLPSLAALNISSIGLTSKQFKSTPNVTSRLSNVVSFTASGNTLSQEGMNHLLKCLDENSLQELILPWTGPFTTAVVIAYFASHHLPALTILDLSYCERTSGDIEKLIEALSRCPSLDEVHLDGWNVTEEDLSRLSVQLPVKLFLSGTQMVQLDQLPGRLQSLTLSCCLQQSRGKSGPFSFHSFMF